MGLSGGLAANGGVSVSVGELPASVVSASSPADTPAATVGGSQLVNVPAWKASTLYPAGYVVQQAGIVYTANATFTSASTWGADTTNWTALTAAGVELGYAERTSNFTTSGTPAAETNITELVITVTVASRPIELEFYANCWQSVTSAGWLLGYIRESGTLVAQTASSISSAGNFGPVSAKRRFQPSAGSHTYQASVQAQIASQIVQGGAGDPMYITARQL